MASAEQNLKRLLHYGLPIPFYHPGNRLTSFYIDSVYWRMTDLLKSKDICLEAPNCIVKAFSDGYSPHSSLLVSALAVCVATKNQELKEATYKAVKTVCSSSENLFLFLMLAYNEKDLRVGFGWGRGLRKVLKDWYLKKDVKVLAEIVAKQKKCHGWSHKDIIKLIHLKTDEPARAAIIKYLLFGIKVAKKEYADNPEANEILNYLQAVEDFRHLTDEQQAARNIEIHNFTLDHVPSHLMKSKEVWGALVSTLPLHVLLKNLERIGYLGFLKPNSLLVNKIVDALNDENAIAESHLHPAEVFVTLRSYETSSKFLRAENARKRHKAANGNGEAKKVAKVPPKPNPKIVSTLYDLFASTCKLFLAPTGLRYLVAIDLKNQSTPAKNCFQCRCVTIAQACAVTVLCLLHADRNVSVKVADSNKDLLPVAFNTTMTVQQTVKKLEETSMQRIKLSTPVEWALKKKEEYDIFVVITDTVHKTDNDAISVLQKYKDEMKISNVKLILLFLRNHLKPNWVSRTDEPGVFFIEGFDRHVPRLIEAFSRGAF